MFLLWKHANRVTGTRPRSRFYMERQAAQVFSMAQETLGNVKQLLTRALAYEKPPLLVEVTRIRTAAQTTYAPCVRHSVHILRAVCVPAFDNRVTSRVTLPHTPTQLRNKKKLKQKTDAGGILEVPPARGHQQLRVAPLSPQGPVHGCRYVAA
jgi:hypothetical protein